MTVSFPTYEYIGGEEDEDEVIDWDDVTAESVDKDSKLSTL